MAEETIVCPTCNGAGKIPKPEPLPPRYPPVPEGARYQHDRQGCEFLGQYDDADLYAEFRETASKDNEWKLPAGRYGSIFLMRVCDARFLGVHEMLHKMSVETASKVTFEADPYMYTAYRLAQERGWIQEPDRPSRVKCLCIKE